MLWISICRDLFSRKRFYFWGFSLILVLLIRHLIPSHNNANYLLFSATLITLVSTWQLLLSYFKSERIQAYYQLPISNTKFYIQFIFVAFASNLIERLSLLIILFSEAKLINLILPILSSLFVIMSSFRLVWCFGTLKNKVTKLLLLLYIFISLSLFLLLKSIYLLLFMIAIEWIFILRDDNFLYLDDFSNTNHFLKFKNYFVSNLVKERYFYFNTLASVLFILILYFQKLPENLKIPLLFTVASTNTPLTSLISSEPQLRIHLRSLPKSYIFYNMYLRCLLYYYLFINFLIAIVYVTSSHSIIFLVWVGIFTLFESALSLFLEKYWYIKKWNIKKELWKHPRKYIVPMMTYLFFFILLMLKKF